MSARFRHRTAIVAALVLAPIGTAVLPLSPPVLLAAQATTQGSVAEPGVREALQRYAAAFESIDANAVKKVQPSIASESLAKAFKEMRELKVAIDEVRVLSAEPTNVRLSCRVTQTLTPRAGAKQTTSVNRVMRLRKTGDSWVIDGFER
jgi:hypothetical protein